MKITQLKIDLDFSEKPKQEAAYRLYSCLLSRIDREYGEYLHRQDTFAVSHYLDTEGKWIVSLFGEEAYEQLMPAFEEKKFNLFSEGTAEIRSIDVKQYEKLIGIGGDSRQICFSFVSPTAFKSRKKYENFPTVEHIVKSIVKKWLMVNPQLIDDETANKIADGLSITDYNLRSSFFVLKSVKIPAFTGDAVIESRLGGMENRVWNSIADFANFSGVGIKTSLGMGGVNSRAL